MRKIFRTSACRMRQLHRRALPGSITAGEAAGEEDIDARPQRRRVVQRLFGGSVENLFDVYHRTNHDTTRLAQILRCAFN